jgi:hypothetical protein
MYYIVVRQSTQALLKGGEDMDEMPTTTEYILRMVLELIEKCETLEELREAVKNVLSASK